MKNMHGVTTETLKGKENVDLWVKLNPSEYWIDMYAR